MTEQKPRPTEGHDPFTEAKLGSLRLRNRLTRTAAFEGMCPDGAPSAQLCEHHRRMAAGGVSLTTVAYCSVSPEGRTYGHQLWMRPSILAELQRLTDAVCFGNRHGVEEDLVRVDRVSAHFLDLVNIDFAAIQVGVKQ